MLNNVNLLFVFLLLEVLQFYDRIEHPFLFLICLLIIINSFILIVYLVYMILNLKGPINVLYFFFQFLSVFLPFLSQIK